MPTKKKTAKPAKKVNGFFKVNFKNARLHYKLTQKAASELLDINVSNLGVYEEGRAEPSLETIQKIIKGYKIPLSKSHIFLFGEFDMASLEATEPDIIPIP